MLWYDLYLRKRVEPEDGVITSWTVIVMPLLLFFAFGLTWDVGGALRARAEAVDVASSAARAGAAQFTREGPPGLDVGEAVAVASTYIDQYPRIAGSATVDGESVVVFTSVRYDAAFFPGLSWNYVGESIAEAQIGIRGPGDAG